jgi:two-component system sensor histidine kinase HydH
MRIKDKNIRTSDIFEVIIENFPDIIHSLDNEGNIIMTNKKAESLLGYPQEEMLGMNISQIYADEILEDVEKGFESLKKTGEKSVESALKDRYGNLIPVEIRSFSIYDDDGKFIRTFSILRDIRKVKGLQEGLIHAERLAAIGELATGIVHDINNPLTYIVDPEKQGQGLYIDIG